MLHAGRLDAWGEAGAGSVFRLTLPRRVGEEFESSPLPLVPPDRQPATVGAADARLPNDAHKGTR
jgi:two-component system sensor histidine kinase MtrB